MSSSFPVLSPPLASAAAPPPRSPPNLCSRLPRSRDGRSYVAISICGRRCAQAGETRSGRLASSLYRTALLWAARSGGGSGRVGLADRRRARWRRGSSLDERCAASLPPRRLGLAGARDIRATPCSRSSCATLTDASSTRARPRAWHGSRDGGQGPATSPGREVHMHRSSRSNARIASIAHVRRRHPTLSEQKLWARLKGSQLGVGFRRELVIARFIVDPLLLRGAWWSRSMAATTPASRPRMPAGIALSRARVGACSGSMRPWSWRTSRPLLRSSAARSSPQLESATGP